MTRSSRRPIRKTTLQRVLYARFELSTIHLYKFVCLILRNVGKSTRNMTGSFKIENENCQNCFKM